MNSAQEDWPAPWQPPSRRRAAELATQNLLTLADIIELTGQAPDSGGQVGLFDVDETGFRYTLSEASLRGHAAQHQVMGRRFVEQGHLNLPCRPADLVAFFSQWAELDLPRHFVEIVQGQEAERELDQWRDDLIHRLQAQGLASHPVDYAAFRLLTTFDSGELPHTGGEDAQYAYRRDDLGHVVGVEAAGSILTNAFGPEGVEAAEWQRRAQLSLPTTAGELVRWVRDQGGDVELDFEGSETWPVDLERWVDALAVMTRQSPGNAAGTAVRGPSGEERHNQRWSEARSAIHDVLERIKREGRPIHDIEKAVRAGLIEEAAKAAEQGTAYPFKVGSGRLMKERRGGLGLAEYSRDALKKVLAVMPKADHGAVSRR